MREVEADYARELDRLIDEVFETATYDLEMTWGELAKEAGLSYATVCKLGNRETNFPQLRSIIRLGIAVGMEVKMIKRRLKARKAA